MTSQKSILLGLGAIGALVLAGGAGAQVTGGVGGTVGGAVSAPAPAIPATPAVPAVPGVEPATPAVPATPAMPSASSAASAGADASARASGFAAGMVVRDSAGVQLGTIMAPDPSMDTAGRVRIQTGSGFITVPAATLTLQGGVAVSSQSNAEISASGKAKTE